MSERASENERVRRTVMRFRKRPVSFGAEELPADAPTRAPINTIALVSKGRAKDNRHY